MVISPLNYTGNKAKSLRELLDIFPKEIDTFYDIFCGSGLVGSNSNAKKIVANDLSIHAIKLLEYLKDTPTFRIISNMESIIEKYKLTDSKKMPKGTYVEYKHEGLSLYNKPSFIKMRSDFNKSAHKDYALLFALTIFGFNHYIRFNSKGLYNVPVGKVDFSQSLYEKTVSFSELLKSKNIEISNLDFRNPILYANASEHDLFYFDPPYMITSAPYNAFWTAKEEHDLLNLLDKLNKRGIKFALSNVFYSNGKTNDILIEWSKKYRVHEIKRQYKNANYRRKNHSLAREVLITNFRREV